MTKFNVGDKVEFIEDCLDSKKGDTFTVTAVSDAVFGCTKQLVRGRKAAPYSGVFAHRLKMVEPAVQVGDIIEVTKAVWSATPVGTRMIVSKVQVNGSVQARVENR